MVNKRELKKYLYEHIKANFDVKEISDSGDMWFSVSDVIDIVDKFENKKTKSEEIGDNIDKMLKNVMQNYPEAGSGNALQCTGWAYELGEFEFRDIEENKNYEINFNDIRKGFDLMLKLMFTGKISSFDFIDEGNWDDETLDMLVQCVIFKDVIYG